MFHMISAIQHIVTIILAYLQIFVLQLQFTLKLPPQITQY